MLAPMLRATTKSTIANATSTPITRLNMLMKWVSCLLTAASRKSRTRRTQYNGLGEGFVNSRPQSGSRRNQGAPAAAALRRRQSTAHRAASARRAPCHYAALGRDSSTAAAIGWGDHEAY